MTGSECYKILVVDDEAAILRSYEAVLSGAIQYSSKLDLRDLEAALFSIPAEPAPVGFAITARSQGVDAVEEIKRTAREPKANRYAVAFVDVRMPPGINGIVAARHMHEIDPEMRIVFVTGYSDFSTRQIASEFPEDARIFFLRKPFGGDEVTELARTLSKEWAGTQAIGTDEAKILARFDLHQLAGHSAACSAPR